MTDRAAVARGDAPPRNELRGEVNIRLKRNGAWQWFRLAPEYQAIAEIEAATAKSVVRLAREIVSRGNWSPFVSDLAQIIAAGIRAAGEERATVMGVGEMLVETGPVTDEVIEAVSMFLGNCLSGRRSKEESETGELKPAGGHGPATPSPSAAS